LIQPSSCVHWLGFFLDNKLSYKKHVQTKIAAAQKVFQRIRRLGNTQRGLSTQATEQLYTACVSSIADYGIQLWWGKRKGTILKNYKLLQNSALQQTLEVFKGPPIKAMEIEAAVLPVKLEPGSSAINMPSELLPLQRLTLFRKQCGNKGNFVFPHSWVSLQGRYQDPSMLKRSPLYSLSHGASLLLLLLPLSSHQTTSLKQQTFTSSGFRAWWTSQEHQFCYIQMAPRWGVPFAHIISSRDILVDELTLSLVIRNLEAGPNP
jgi:hypothetical protein